MKYEFFDSPIHNIGCRATVDIKKGEIVAKEPFFKITKQNNNFFAKDYLWNKNTLNFKDKGLFSLLINGLGNWCNHSYDNNLTLKNMDDKFILFIATKNIKKGDELFNNYGENWWKKRNNKKLIGENKRKPILSDKQSTSKMPFYKMNLFKNNHLI
tara:strand:+ start:4638 stop:5105 length:468 start_codon:yes stop_codon:yes gene_type:complete